MAFRAIAKAFTILTRNDQPLVWKVEQEATFQELEERLVTTLILQRFILGWSYRLHIDWSSLEIGAILT